MYSTDQRLFTSESGCGSRYGQSMREAFTILMQRLLTVEEHRKVDKDLRQGFHKDSQGTLSDAE